MPLFLIVIISYAAYFYLLTRWDRNPGFWAYIGAVAGVPIVVMIAALILRALGVEIITANDSGECVRWDWATGECREMVDP